MSEIPAFPCAHSEQLSNNQDGAPYQSGMTLRDYFAGQALIGMMQAMRPFSQEYQVNADSAYLQADAMIKARAPLPTPPINPPVTEGAK